MKPLLLLIFSFEFCLAWGQTFTTLNKELMQFISKNISNDTSKEWIENIVSHRDTFHLKKQLEAISANQIKIVEVFDRISKKYGIKEVYANNNEIESIYRDQIEDTFYNKSYKYRFDKIDTIKSGIVYFPPNTVEALCGCGQVPMKIKRPCIRAAKKKAKKDGYVSESFARLITYIDKKKGTIIFTLELPVVGKRKVAIVISPDCDNRRWYD